MKLDMRVTDQTTSAKLTSKVASGKRMIVLKTLALSMIAIVSMMFVNLAHADCTPGEKQCQSGSVMRCNDRGTKWLHAGERCSGDYREDRVRDGYSDRRRSEEGCTPGEKECQGSSVMRCNSRGTKWLHHGERC